MVWHWVPSSHIIAQWELHLEGRVLANPFDHWESLIHISVCVEASYTVENEPLSVETITLEVMKRFCDISNLQITWKKNQPVHIHTHGCKSSD